MDKMCCMSKHLTLEERAVIRAKIDSGCTVREISRTVQRAPSTISRELRRNGCNYRTSVPAKHARPKSGRPRKGYDVAAAQKRARRNARLPRVARKLRIGHPECLLWQALFALLKAKHSPECACGILKQMYPDKPELHLSHESFYTAFYLMPKGELRDEIVALLRRERAHRRGHGIGKSRRGRIIDLVPISERPSEVEERIIPGHWEGDLIKGVLGRSAIGTAVERTTLFTVLAKMPSACSLDCVQAFAGVLNRIAVQKRLSLTYDRGKEMAAHAKLTQLTQMKVFFADPHSPWQRGINENTNGLLRQYFPKKTDLSVYSQDELDQVAWQLNTRPRKSLGWKCPAQMMMPEFDFNAHFLRTFGDLTKLKPH
jgi:transposase, IS30 family